MQKNIDILEGINMIGLNDYRVSIMQRLLIRNNCREAHKYHMVCKAMVIRSNPRNLFAARDISEQIAHDCGFCDEDIFDIKLAVSEALSNAMLHGSPRGRKSLVRLVFFYNSDSLRIVISDEGSFRHWQRSLDPESEGGRGLNLIARYMDEFSVKPSASGTKVTLVKSRYQSNKACA
jgi:anti-sigma regulatory factor (Ser/Thr protein kinase)